MTNGNPSDFLLVLFLFQWSENLTLFISLLEQILLIVNAWLYIMECLVWAGCVDV